MLCLSRYHLREESSILWELPRIKVLAWKSMKLCKINILYFIERQKKDVKGWWKCKNRVVVDEMQKYGLKINKNVGGCKIKVERKINMRWKIRFIYVLYEKGMLIIKNYVKRRRVYL